MKSIDWKNVEEAQEFETVKPGGYVCRITAVSDVPEKEYLKVEFDIEEGEFKGYYRELYGAKGFWGGSFIRSYKKKAQPFFKGFLTAVKGSNAGFTFEDNEKNLINKLVGLVLGEEEYKSKDDSIKVRLYTAQIHSIDKIKKNEFEVPKKKVLAISAFINTSDFEDLDDDMPF